MIPWHSYVPTQQRNGWKSLAFVNGRQFSDVAIPAEIRCFNLLLEFGSDGDFRLTCAGWVAGMIYNCPF